MSQPKIDQVQVVICSISKRLIGYILTTHIQDHNTIQVHIFEAH